jgi:MHS family shikimate/dehydroshikimate transporter-like MFS transporter
MANSKTSTKMRPASSAKRAAIAGMAGAVMDWYDFYIYGLVAAVVFPKLFFPLTNPANSTLLTFATFGVGFLARPLGGIVFGHYGDRIGRKAMLVLTLLMMGTGTAAVGFLPTYADVGLLAPVLLVILRFVQGFALGGEWGGAALMAVEHAPDRRRGFFGSFVQVGASIGFLTATAVVFLCSSLTSSEQFLAWGWRIPFLLSVFVVLGGYWVRRGVDETPEFVHAVKETQTEVSVPLLEALRRHPTAFVAIIGMRLAELVGFFTVTVFALNYGVGQGIPRNQLLNALLAIGAVAIVLIPLCGALSDRIGRRPVFVAGAVIGVLGAFPLFWAIESHNLVLITLAFVLVANLSHDPMVAVQQPLFTEMFGPAFRYSGAGFAYQLASAIAGGFTPFVAAWLSQRDGGGYGSVATFLACACLASVLVGLVFSGPGASATASLRKKTV